MFTVFCLGNWRVKPPTRYYAYSEERGKGNQEYAMSGGQLSTVLHHVWVHVMEERHAIKKVGLRREKSTSTFDLPQSWMISSSYPRFIIYTPSVRPDGLTSPLKKISILEGTENKHVGL